jgi:hypothetical protein
LDVFSPVDQNGSFCFDRVIKSGRILRRVKKKGAWKASWKPAYLVLRPNLLSIYGNVDETDLRESIALSDITAVARVRKSHLDNVFGVFSPSKNYHFQTTVESEIVDWVSKIRIEARTEDDLDTLEPLDPPAPRFSRRNHHEPSSAANGNGYETTDLSADDSPEPAHSPNVSRQRGQSAIEPPTTEHLNTSHSSFSDFASGSSLPKHGILSTSAPNKTSALTPIASASQLRPPLSTRNTSQLSIPGQQTQPTDPISALDKDRDRVIRQGHLSILHSHARIKQWKSLWAVLRPSSLSFYKSEAEYSVLKMLPVRSIIDAVEVDPLGRNREWCFEVIAEEKTLRCSVRTEEDMVGWLGGLKSIVARRRERARSGEGERLAEGIKAMNL